MTRFEVWAPRPDRVVLSLEGREVPADRAGDGWWAVEVGDAEPEARYGWALDGAPPVADPCSRRQPDGALGVSQLVPEGFASWTDQAFRPPPPASLALYELHVGTFTTEGTFDAAVERIDHLVGLGVNAVEVMPIASFPGVRGWGYDGVSLTAAHEPYGGPAGFARFVDACHRAGLAVVLDVVLNHLGPLGNHLARFGPYFTDAVSTPWGDAVNLDGPGSDEVRSFLLDVCRWWLVDLHVDGLRLDAVHALHDTSPRHLLAELAAEAGTWAAATERRLGLIAESDRNDPAYVTPLEAGGIGLDAMWADDCHHVLHVALTGERDGYYEDYTGAPSELADVLANGYLYRGQRSPHRRRTVGRPLPGDVGLDRIVWSAQNHDQVGNRARGERLGHLAGTGRLYAPAAVVLLGPAVPMVFQGEEWAASTPFGYVTDHPDADLAAAVRAGRRAEFAAFGWDPEDVLDPQDPATHDRSVLRWDELDRPPHAAVLAWYRTLLRLRRTRPELRDGRHDAITVEADDDAGWVRFRRHGAGPAAPGTEVVVNLGAEAAPVPVDARLIPLALSPGAEHRGPRVVLPAGGAAVLEVPPRRGG